MIAIFNKKRRNRVFENQCKSCQAKGYSCTGVVCFMCPFAEHDDVDYEDDWRCGCIHDPSDDELKQNKCAYYKRKESDQ